MTLIAEQKAVRLEKEYTALVAEKETLSGQIRALEFSLSSALSSKAIQDRAREVCRDIFMDEMCYFHHERIPFSLGKKRSTKNSIGDCPRA